MATFGGHWYWWKYWSYFSWCKNLNRILCSSILMRLTPEVDPVSCDLSYIKILHSLRFFCILTVKSLSAAHIFSQHLYQSIFSWEVRNDYDTLNLAGICWILGFSLRIYEKHSTSGVVHHNPGANIGWWNIQ